MLPFSCMAWTSFSSPAASMAPSRLIICFTFFLFVSFLPPTAVADISDDAAALLAFKAGVGKALLPSWNSSDIGNICNDKWDGVSCTGNGSTARVTSLRLPGTGLSGAIPARTLGKLDALQSISLRKNYLSGGLPSDIANCSSLRQLSLTGNFFSGALPDFSAWPQLDRLDLSLNNFSGEIPSSLNNLTRLTYLLLQNNSLSGQIPSLSTIAGHLDVFSVANNDLVGEIPSSLSKFNSSSFTGNSGLCGKPLQLSCPVTGPTVGPESSPPSSSSKKLSGGAIAAIVIGSLAAVALIILCCALVLWRKRANASSGEVRNGKADLFAAGRQDFENRSKRKGDKDRSAAVAASSGGDGGAASVATVAVPNNKLTFVGSKTKESFDLEDLLRASAEVLGKGTLGTTYKAVMSDGLVLTVKRLKEHGDQQQQHRQDALANMVGNLGCLEHENLVPLRAYFFAQAEKLLVSDYMPNGSLSTLLHGNKGLVGGGVVDWETRVAIAAGVAKGLVHLHSKKVVHGDLKSSNVLMDRDGKPRLSDYGLGQLVEEIQSGAANRAASSATSKKPSNAYMASDPSGRTYKGDVYSFGVLLLELLTGKSPTTLLLQEGIHLPTWVASNPRQEEVLDHRILKYDYVHDEMIALLHIALPCVSAAPDRRPHMVEVVRQIQRLVDDAHPDHVSIHGASSDSDGDDGQRVPLV